MDITETKTDTNEDILSSNSNWHYLLFLFSVAQLYITFQNILLEAFVFYIV